MWALCYILCLDLCYRILYKKHIVRISDYYVKASAADHKANRRVPDHRPGYSKPLWIQQSTTNPKVYT